MAWITITESDLLTRLSGAELSAFRAAALAEDQPDPLAVTIEAVVEEIRGFLAAGHWPLGPVLTIPRKLANVALDRIVWELMKRPGATIIDTNDARKDANARALALLRDVAARKFAVEDPDQTEVTAPPITWGSETKLDL